MMNPHACGGVRSSSRRVGRRRRPTTLSRWASFVGPPYNDYNDNSQAVAFALPIQRAGIDTQRGGGFLQRQAARQDAADVLGFQDIERHRPADLYPRRRRIAHLPGQVYAIQLVTARQDDATLDGVAQL